MQNPAARSQVPALGFVLFILFAGPSAVSASQVTDQMKSTIDGVLHLVTNADYKNDRQTQRRMIHDLIDKRFSYEQMSMRSLAKNWKSISQDEQREFVQLFSKLLENSYANKIESASDEKVDYKEEKVKGQYALIKTEIIRSTGSIEVDYKLIQLKDEWKVYDLVIEGVSLVRNYRSQFNRIIHQESYDALKKKIIARISDIESDQKVSDEL